MKKRHMLRAIAISGILVFSMAALATPAGHDIWHAFGHKVAEAAEGSWICSKCGFHIVTKSGNRPGGGSCFKNNNGSHNWVRGD